MTVVQHKEAITTIVKARTALETKGWIQGSYATEKGYCLLGALRHANGVGETEATRIVRNLIGMDLANWNDKNGRSFGEVKTMLLAAENIARELAE